MSILIFCSCAAILLIIILLMLVPFPSWNAYFTLWKYTLFDRESSIDFQLRLKQVGYLLTYTLQLPLLAFLWCLDEVIFAEYRRIPIHRPVFVVCQPRSGSTFLHRTLANDEETFVSVRNIDLLYPSILVQKFLKLTGRFEKLSQVSVWGNNEHGKVADEMHRSFLLDYEEDDCIFSDFFLHSFFMTTRFPFPQLFNYMVDRPSPQLEEKMLQTHRKLMQKLLYLAGGDRIYLSKITESHTMLKKIAELYPDALFIAQTRDADKSMNSELAQVSSTSMCKIGIDVYNIPSWEESHFTYRVTSSQLQIEFFESLPEDQKLCLSYNLFVKNIANTIKIIYDVLGLTVSDKLKQYLDQLQESQNSRKRTYKTGNRHYSELEFYQQFVEQTEKEHADQLNQTVAKKTSQF